MCYCNYRLAQYYVIISHARSLEYFPLQIEVYLDQYTRAFKANLTSYAEAQIHHSKQSYQTLSKLKEELVGVQLEN